MTMTTKRNVSLFTLGRPLLGLAVLLIMLVAMPTAAHAAFGIESFTGSATGPGGSPLLSAGAHPDLQTRLSVGSRTTSTGDIVPDGNLKDVIVQLPSGIVGDPTVVPTCPAEPFYRLYVAACAKDTQIGVASLTMGLGGTQSVSDTTGLYNLDPPPGVAARFGFNYLSVIVVLDAKVTAAGGYHVEVASRYSSQGIALFAIGLTLWGVPADSSHDTARGGVASGQPRRAFITNPTACTGQALVTSVVANSWQQPDVFSTASFDRDPDGTPFVMDNCAAVPFAPVLSVETEAHAPDQPTGASVDIDLPQSDDPDGLGTAHLRDAVMTFPSGMSINPGSANGLAACSDTEIGLGSDAASQCPAASKIGTVEATTPLLVNPLQGSLYVGTQRSDDPESGQMFRVFMVVRDDERGVMVKLPGQLRADAATGQLKATFADNPQMPVSHIHLVLKDGPRAPLATAVDCGPQRFGATFASWAGHVRQSDADVAMACPAGSGGFTPSLTAGTLGSAAGGSSPFALSIVKPDGNVAVNGLSMVLPTGLLAKLKGNLGTRVGSVKAFAGPGANPYMLPGRVFLEGAYGDAPFSLKVVVPAKAGPFDLGEVVVRQKIYVDPIDAHVTVVSDPLPTIVKGVPVRLQRLEVNVDKPGFMVNPTSCAPKTIGGTLGGADGQTAPINVRFQVGECGSLALKPALALTLSGKGQTVDGKHPAVTANLTQPAGQSNLKRVRVALPLSLALDPDNANGLCEFADGSKATPTCPKASIVGTATAVTPVLDQPLSGPVYFVKNQRTVAATGRQRATLPKLVIPLVGENGVKLTLTGTSAVEDGQLVTTFDNIPDAPVSSFKLNINGGKGGILTVSGADICKGTQIAEQEVDGQNNKATDADVSIQTPSCPLKVISKTVGKTAVKLKVGGLGAGKVTVSGKGIKKTTKTIVKSTVATITVRRTKARLGSVKVSFVPKGSKKAKSVTARLR
jgi:hypothetical protein